MRIWEKIIPWIALTDNPKKQNNAIAVIEEISTKPQIVLPLFPFHFLAAKLPIIQDTNTTKNRNIIPDIISVDVLGDISVNLGKIGHIFESIITTFEKSGSRNL